MTFPYLNFFHEIIIGMMFGWGVAIPIGPMNIEIMRRNLQDGFLPALIFNLGVCLTDLTYLLLLSVGALLILHHSWWLKLINIVGAIILGWFGYKALIRKPQESTKPVKIKHYRSLLLQGVQGYVMTLLSPFTLLFWTSISGQVALIAQRNTSSALGLALGVTFGIFSWMIGFNLFIHATRHKLSPKVIRWFNIIGGILIIGFAIIGLWRAIAVI